jgi:hypothetical protein
MKIHVETTREFGHVLVRLGEATVIGGAAGLFVQGFSLWASFVALSGGSMLVLTGLYFINASHLKKLKEQ